MTAIKSFLFGVGVAIATLKIVAWKLSRTSPQPPEDQASKLRALCKFGQSDFTREYPRKG